MTEKELLSDDGKVSGEARAHMFHQLLMKLLNDEVNPKAMWWLPDGQSFAIDPDVMPGAILDKYFQGTKFNSFIRRLHSEGFRRATRKYSKNTGHHFAEGIVVLSHDLFQRDAPELLDKIPEHLKALKNNKKKSKAAKKDMSPTKESPSSSPRRVLTQAYKEDGFPAPTAPQVRATSNEMHPSLRGHSPSAFDRSAWGTTGFPPSFVRSLPSLAAPAPSAMNRTSLALEGGYNANNLGRYQGHSAIEEQIMQEAASIERQTRALTGELALRERLLSNFEETRRLQQMGHLPMLNQHMSSSFPSAAGMGPGATAGRFLDQSSQQRLLASLWQTNRAASSDIGFPHLGASAQREYKQQDPE